MHNTNNVSNAIANPFVISFCGFVNSSTILAIPSIPRKNQIANGIAKNSKTYFFQEVKADFETHLDDFELFWYSKPVNTLREFGLLVL